VSQYDLSREQPLTAETLNPSFVSIATRLAVCVLVAATGCQVESHSTSSEAPQMQVATAHYLANAGVLVVSGETKIVFDPLFRNDYGTYRLVPQDLERALFAGEPPFDGIDAVLISHYHEDHFSAVDILRLLHERPQIHLYAPAQAVSGMRDLADATTREVFERVTEIALEYKDAPITIEAGALLIEAVRIPHSGWPEGRADVENIAFRVTLDDTSTVLHLGDADANDVHYAHDAAYWDQRATHLALPPYWYFSSDEGRSVLENRLKPTHSVGVHVPTEMPSREEQRPAELQGFDLFIEPGETRTIRR
jgi:L-ascorbate metabolism protein UlaG (beta-lactamase superfamily)